MSPAPTAPGIATSPHPVARRELALLLAGALAVYAANPFGIGLRAVELLRAAGIDQLHSRKLRSFAEVTFQ